MKRLFSIMFSLMLVWLPFAPMSASASAASVTVCTKCVSVDCCMPNCCAAKPVQSPQPTPAVPTQGNGSQIQISFITFAAMLWSRPENSAHPTASPFLLPASAVSAPLYERNCTLLI